MSAVCCAVGTTNIKAKVLKDGHLFVVHILDPQLELSEEIPSSGLDNDLQSLVKTDSEPNLGTPSAMLLLAGMGVATGGGYQDISPKISPSKLFMG